MRPNFPPPVLAEMERANHTLRSLIGVPLDTVSINSLKQADAPFLAANISKLSPIIGNLLERKIIELLEDESGVGLRWIRQDPGFPDALLVDAAGQSTGAGYEVKAWYALSTEITARFRESVNLLLPRNVKVVVIAWVMGSIIYGQPTIIDIITLDALSLAETRDRHYHRPPGYLTVEPRDTSLRTRNLQQTNVNGYKIQDMPPEQRAEAERIVLRSPGRVAPPHSPDAQQLNIQLMNRFPYRLDTNFAKIDRIDHPELERFKSSVLNSIIHGHTIKQWVTILRNIERKADGDYDRAVAEVQRLYGA
jgi:hypothetical protein